MFANIARRIVSEAEEWIAGMASPFMCWFITCSLILAAAMWVAILVMVTL